MTPNEVLTALGGRPAVAEKLNAPLRAVHSWASRGFPAHTWHRIAALAVEMGVAGITVETLARPLWQGRRRGAVPAVNDSGPDAKRLSSAA